MPIPDLNAAGFLPEGVHDCTLAELQNRFGRFQTSDCRPALYAKLSEFVALLIASGLGQSLIVDGSFVSQKDEPGDIDLVLILPADHDLAADVLPIEYSVLSRKRVKRRFPFDYIVALENSEPLSYYLDLFQSVKYQPGQRKGVLRLVL